jgi:hypothetical protein
MDINYDSFYKLKLSDFFADKEGIETLENWEFMDDIWFGEAIGFSEWLVLQHNIKEKSISLDLNDFSDDMLSKIASALNLNIVKGLSKDAVMKQFGHPKNTVSFVSDRVSFEYIIGSIEKYYLSLTITDDEGLIYVVLTNHTQTITKLEQIPSL